MSVGIYCMMIGVITIASMCVLIETVERLTIFTVKVVKALPSATRYIIANDKEYFGLGTMVLLTAILAALVLK